MKEKRPDDNRLFQMESAKIAMLNGYTRARRKVSSIACEICSELDGEVVDIFAVMSGSADHKNGQCTFTFLK
jgi:hypothetical protein